MAIEPSVVRNAQLRMLEILTAIHNVCEKYDIKYFIMYGTLLGAIRHKGFIPWDDDCDICMMRGDWERFVEIASKELPQSMFLQTRSTDKHYSRRVAKVRDLSSKIVEVDESDNEKYHQGLYVDIFVFDYHKYGRALFRFINFEKTIKGVRKNFKKGSLMRAIVGSIMNVPWMIHRLFIYLFIYLSKIWRKDASLENIDISLNLQLTYDYLEYSNKRIFPLTKYIFENQEFWGPGDYDYVLSKIYGDYMTLPKEENRYWHAKKIEV